MKASQMIVLVATRTGWPLEYIGRLAYRQLVYMVTEIDYQRRCEAYRIEYRIGQVMAILTSDSKHTNRPEQFVGEVPEKAEVTVNMTQVKRTQSVVLGDGKTYELPMIDANIMEAIEEEFDAGWVDIFAKPRAKVFKAILHQLLLPQLPKITRAEVGALLTIKAQSNFAKVIKQLI